jgi:hypothetical protein
LYREFESQSQGGLVCDLVVNYYTLMMPPLAAQQTYAGGGNGAYQSQSLRYGSSLQLAASVAAFRS